MSRKPLVSPETKLWSILDMLKSRNKLTDYDLAIKAEVSERTVRYDRANPEKIPLGRLIRYCGVFIAGNDLVSFIESSLASIDKEDKSR